MSRPCSTSEKLDLYKILVVRPEADIKHLGELRAEERKLH
jgi:hypothetical protein